ncbi:MAG: hypothetical protein Q9159_003285 [Coniocarpon cinnabarinum]
MAETQSVGEQTSAEGEQKKGRFEPKVPVKLDPPKYDPISPDYLLQCTGQNPDYPTYVAIKGLVYDVTGNKAYGPEGPYKVFSGHDASRALGKTSTKEEDVRPEWDDLPDGEKNTLNDWVTFFSKRYSVVGVVQDAKNMDQQVLQDTTNVNQQVKSE